MFLLLRLNVQHFKLFLPLLTKRTHLLILLGLLVKILGEPIRSIKRIQLIFHQTDSSYVLITYSIINLFYRDQ